MGHSVLHGVFRTVYIIGIPKADWMPQFDLTPLICASTESIVLISRWEFVTVTIEWPTICFTVWRTDNGLRGQYTFYAWGSSVGHEDGCELDRGYILLLSCEIRERSKFSKIAGSVVSECVTELE